MKHAFLLFLFLLALGMRPGVLAAQELDLGANADVPPKILREAEKVHAKCQKDKTLSSHFECECRSKRFLEERMRAGPKASEFAIIQGISDECFNIDGGAEYALDKCEGSGRFAYESSYDDGTSFEEFCQCVSANYAIAFEALEGAVSRVKLNRLMTTSLLRCKKPLPGQKNVYKRLDQ